MRPAATATRTSARIEARQGTILPSWTIPTGNNDERRLMQALIAHLQATDNIDDAGLYRYLFKESDVIRNDLKNVKVFRRIRSQLAGFRVPFMQYDPVNRKWRYWNDFTLTGLTVWRDQTRDHQQDDDTSSAGEEEATVPEDLAALDVASETTMEDHPDLSDEIEQPVAAGSPRAYTTLDRNNPSTCDSYGTGHAHSTTTCGGSRLNGHGSSPLYHGR